MITSFPYIFNNSENMTSWILGIFLFIVAVSCCCLSDNKDSNSTTTKRNVTPRKTYTRQDNYSYCECPSCGSPYYDGYCEECGYPDVNQGWVGENY